jgi:hypothetical protein
MLRLGFEPVEVMLTLPVAAPLAVGEKRTAKEVLCPAVNVKGKDKPFKLNPAPLAVAAEMVRLDPPVLARVSDKFALLPTCTLPKARVVGFAVSELAATPVPESEMLSGELDASETMLNAPLAAPALVGAKVVVKVTL